MLYYFIVVVVSTIKPDLSPAHYSPLFILFHTGCATVMALEISFALFKWAFNFGSYDNIKTIRSGYSLFNLTNLT